MTVVMIYNWFCYSENGEEHSGVIISSQIFNVSTLGNNSVILNFANNVSNDLLIIYMRMFGYRKYKMLDMLL